jgi:hypothetical protein
LADVSRAGIAGISHASLSTLSESCEMRVKIAWEESFQRNGAKMPTGLDLIGLPQFWGTCRQVTEKAKRGRVFRAKRIYYQQVVHGRPHVLTD